MKVTGILIVFIIFFKFNLDAQNITDELVAYWSFDNDDENTVVDQSANHLNGTSYNITYTTGRKGKAAVFNSLQDEIHFPVKNGIPPTAISGLETGSISVWFKYQSVGGQMLPILYFGESASGTPHNSLIIEIGHGENANNRRLYFTIVNKGFCFDSGSNLDENVWYHFVAVVSATKNTGYLNGKEMTSRNYNLGSNASYSDFFTDVPTNETLSIGYGRYGLNDNFFHFKGLIDEVRIYNKAFTEEDVKAIYNDGLMGNAPEITYADVSYGPDARNLLDFWKADSPTPTPLVIFIHGGGFKSGDKSSIREGSGANEIRQCLENGVSFASIIYRFRQTTRLDSILYDCARAVQFLRSKADDWNLDKNKFAAYGGSAGGGASLWLGVHNDLSEPENADIILRESSKLQAVGHENSQATYDFTQWAGILNVANDWMETMNSVEDLELYHISDRSRNNDPDIVELHKLLDMPAHMDKNDPPIFIQNFNSTDDPDIANEVIHHPRHAIFLKNKCDELGIPSEIVLQSTPIDQRTTSIDFFLKIFNINTSHNLIEENKFKIFPNPANDFIQIYSEKEMNKVDLYNSTGIKVNSFHPLQNHLEINCKKYPKGIYFLRINDTRSSKLIIQ